MAVFDYKISVTGDCSNTDVGDIKIQPFGGTPPYTIEYISPISETYVGVVTEETKTGLSATTYVVRINDSSLPINQEFYVNIPVSSGVCGNVISVQSTTCDSNNGSVIISANTFYSSTIFTLYDSNDNVISSAITNTSQAEFTNLSPNRYYCIITDLGGCSAQTSDIIIEESTSLDFGVYVVSNTSCGGSPTGKIFVTGETGVPPYTYLWSNGETSSFISGVSDGSYSVQVTDADNCSITKSATVNKVLPIGFGVATVIQPSPFTNNGSITITSTGGTVPFYYSATTGDFLISYSQSWTITGLPAGDYGFLVTDAAFCTYDTAVSLLAADGISSVEVVVDNSFSSKPNGSVTVIVDGGFTPYTYRLIYPNTNIINVTNNLQTFTFENLESGDYMLIVQDSGGSTFSEPLLITNNQKFSIQTLVTTPTCNSDNGEVQVNILWDECNCCENLYYVFAEDILSATGNTDNPDYNNKVWINYTNCEGNMVNQSYGVEGIYEFCSTGTCYTTDSNLCLVNELCCEWRVFNEGESVEYTYIDCDGDVQIIMIQGQSYSVSFCSIDPSSSNPLLSIEYVGTCSECNCVGATTNGDYEYYDCSNVKRTGSSNNIDVCVNINRPYLGLELDTSVCNCLTPIKYVFKDNQQVFLPQGYFTSTNTNCCESNGPTFPITYNLDNGEQIISNSFLTNVVFSNLSSGEHVIIVTDSQGYEVTQNFVIDNSESCDFTLFATSCGDGNDGSISVIITSGLPPYFYQWSDNVPGNPQENYVTNLTADTYTLSVTDSNGCCTAKVIDISCNQNYSSELFYVMGEELFQLTDLGKSSLLKYLNDGFQEIQNTYNNCNLVDAILSVKVSLLPNGYSTQTQFYTSTSLTDVPSDEIYLQAIVSLILTINGVWKVESNLEKNEIVVFGLPGNYDLNGEEIRIELIIDYNVLCS